MPLIVVMHLTACPATFLFSTSGFSSYSIIMALLVSGLWFYGGYQQFAEGEQNRRGRGFFWQAVGVSVLLGYCVGAVAWRTWVGLTVAIVALCVEIWVMSRCWWG